MPQLARLVGVWVLLVAVVACNLVAVPTPDAVPVQTEAGTRLVVAWAEGGNLYVWQTGDTASRRVASGGVVRPYVAPDGQVVVFTRGTNTTPESLWMVEIDGNGEAELIGKDQERTYRAGVNWIGDVLWFSESVLYFNTLAQSLPNYSPRDDLYRANVRTREVSLILGAGRGGRFAFSPDRTRIALARAGGYGKQDGRIAVIDPLGQSRAVDLLYYTGVATGAHMPFYPPLFWDNESEHVYAVVPDPDLLYSDTAEATARPPTRLWQLPIRTPSQRRTLGTVQASFFGLPALNPFAQTWLYLARMPASNTFTIQISALDGSNPRTFTSGTVGTFSAPEWVDGSTAFYYTLATGNVYASDGVEEPYRLTDDNAYSPHFVRPDTLVYVAMQGNAPSLRVMVIGQAPQTIAPLTVIPLFDAVLVRP